MKRLLHISTSRPAATISALRISAATPASGVTFVDNSRGASAATADLSAALDTAVEHVDLSSDADELLRNLIHQLDREAAAYANSTVDESQCAVWACPKATAQTVFAAWKCAAAAYEAGGGPPPSTEHGCSFELDAIGPPSADGTFKAFVSMVITPAAVVAEENEFLPALVIAVRGTASRIDHIVNVNAQPRSAQRYIGPGVVSHSGFLNCAEALDGVVSDRIRRHVRGRPGAHIIFTGHSAGGAVASLLFLRHVMNRDLAPSARLSIITFGAPPVVAQPLDPVGFQQQQLGLCLNIINEFDVVSRADAPYVLCLVNLLRSLYGQPALVDDEVTEETTGGCPNPASDGKMGEAAGQSGTEKVWPTPPPRYHHVGARVVLLMRLNESRLRLRAVEVPGDKFGRLLFCRVAVHRRACYSDRMQELVQWEDQAEEGTSPFQM
ncbi:hypothetical protein O9K51_09800 [Purpureocillium lavendulum]|uniref:Fungal lipase-type domain-containing protein n=1 Tax=Purpureocillium lavendulum TaxID=1247861 RepID=A0AB34FDR6_9HYPO|nr:hypothetical protein O9K51_09800 [Purpureocillium lavendulum]